MSQSKDPNRQDSVERFLSFPTVDRLRMVESGEAASELRAYFGDAAYEEYKYLARETLPKLHDDRHLGIGPDTNLVFVPGVMGSLLFSRGLAGVWWVDLRTRSHINDLRLSPDGERDADPNHDVMPFTADTTYEPFLSAILRGNEFRHEVFPYDWRKSLVLKESTEGLRDLVLKIHKANGGREVHLVAHSMGGLMVRAALMKHGDELWDKVGRIVFVGTPHYGSPAIASYLKNHLWGFDMIGLLGAKYLDRRTFRSLWGVLSLLPAPCGVYPGTRGPAHDCFRGGSYNHPCANFDLYDADAWKLDLTSDSNPLGINSAERDGLQSILDHVRKFHKDLYAWHEALPQELRDKMAVIAGVGTETLYRLAFTKGLFGFGFWESTEKITKSVEGDPHREGDGRVPVVSAALENVGEMRYVKGVHGDLPMIEAVFEDVFRWLAGKKMQLPKTPEEALSGHLGAGDLTPQAQNLVSSASFGSTAGGASPYLWSETPVTDEQLQRMEQELANGQLPDFIRVRLL